jgi:hypothetical protein
MIERTADAHRFLYILFLALDACFRLKRGMVSSELKDAGLGTGWSYMVENGLYREYLLTVTDQKEVCEKTSRRKLILMAYPIDEHL